jgi:hypothetical protein
METTNQTVRLFRPTIGVRIAAVVIATAAIALWATRGPERYRLGAVVAIAVIATLWVADLWLTRVVLRDDCLEFTSHFRRQVISKSEISSVGWDRPAGVRVTLSDGKHVRLPHTGHSFQGQVNSIRAWLHR